MSNKQISQLALVLSDLSDIGHINSSMNFINMSGTNYINVLVAGNTFTMLGDKVHVYSPPKEISFDKFISKIVGLTESEVCNG